MKEACSVITFYRMLVRDSLTGGGLLSRGNGTSLFCKYGNFPESGRLLYGTQFFSDISFYPHFYSQMILETCNYLVIVFK